MENFCYECGKNIGQITEPITISGGYRTDGGRVRVVLENLRALVVKDSGYCRECDDAANSAALAYSELSHP
jgi:hypothetical protein